MTPEEQQEYGTRIACRDLVELLTDFLDGALVPARQREVEAHLAICPPCRAYLDQVERTVTELGRVQATSRLCDDTRADVLAEFRSLIRP